MEEHIAAGNVVLRIEDVLHGVEQTRGGPDGDCFLHVRAEPGRDLDAEHVMLQH
jgi:hypothetical protein